MWGLAPPPCSLRGARVPLRRRRVTVTGSAAPYPLTPALADAPVALKGSRLHAWGARWGEGRGVVRRTCLHVCVHLLGVPVGAPHSPAPLCRAAWRPAKSVPPETVFPVSAAPVWTLSFLTLPSSAPPAGLSPAGVSSPGMTKLSPLPMPPESPRPLRRAGCCSSPASVGSWVPVRKG